MHALGRSRTTRWVAIALCALAFLAVGARYLSLRDERQETEHTVAELTRQTTRALHVLQRLQAKQTVTDASNDRVRVNRDSIRALAAAMHDNLSRAQAETTAAAVGAYTSGVQANNLRACLIGVSQALNQLAVGDGRSLASLVAVDAPCRAAGIV